MLITVVYFALPMAGWLALLWGLRRLLFYLAERYPKVGQRLKQLRSSPAAKRLAIGAAFVTPVCLLWAVLTASGVDALRQLPWVSDLANFFLWEGIGWGFYASLAVIVLLAEGIPRRTLVGLNAAVFSFVSLGVSFGGPILFNVVYLLKVMVPFLPMEWLLRVWS